MKTKYNSEIWKDIENTGGYYQVSNKGRVRRTTNHRGFNIHPMNRYFILTPNFDVCDFLGVGIKINDKRRYCLVHRLVADAFVSNPNNYNIVKHIDGDINNNRASNLKWVPFTYGENIYVNKQKSAEE